jgi:ribosomal protein S18 acetylase RimI-like enzyme
VGVAAGVVSPAGEGELQLDAMWVAPSHRGLGVGELLAEAVRAWAVSAGARTLSLTVVDGNDPARRLYERLGFRGTGERTPRPRDPSRMRERLRLSLCGE